MPQLVTFITNFDLGDNKEHLFDELEGKNGEGKSQLLSQPQLGKLMADSTDDPALKTALQHQKLLWAILNPDYKTQSPVGRWFRLELGDQLSHWYVLFFTNISYDDDAFMERYEAQGMMKSLPEIEKCLVAKFAFKFDDPRGLRLLYGEEKVGDGCVTDKPEFKHDVNRESVCMIQKNFALQLQHRYGFTNRHKIKQYVVEITKMGMMAIAAVRFGIIKQGSIKIPRGLFDEGERPTHDVSLVIEHRGLLVRKSQDSVNTTAESDDGKTQTHDRPPQAKKQRTQ